MPSGASGIPVPPPGPVMDAANLDIHPFKAWPCPFATDLDNLLWSLDACELEGDVLEFGVFQGASLRAMADRAPGRRLFGFDSFEGLPLPWARSPTSTYAQGHFKVPGLPEVPANASLEVGWFSATIPPWKERHAGALALVHIDGDLYESARDVLFGLDDRIVRGTIAVFDELSDWQDSGIYPFWAEGEWKALREWMRERGRKVQVLSRGPKYSATLRVIE
jgi:hypothetical protein